MSLTSQSSGLVLLLSQDETFLTEMSALLHDDGFTVATTSTVAEAVALLQEAQPVVILLDLGSTATALDALWHLRAAAPRSRLIVAGDEQAQAA